MALYDQLIKEPKKVAPAEVEEMPESWRPKPKPEYTCRDCGRKTTEAYAIDGGYRCQSCATPLIAARYAQAPESSEASEEDTGSENALSVASVLTGEPVPFAVLPSAESVIPEPKLEIGHFDVPERPDAEQVHAFLGQNPAETWHQIGELSVTAPQRAAVEPKPRSRRKNSVRLTDKERETATRLGLKSSITAPKYLAHSVLDDFEPVKRAAKQSYGPSKNVLVKCVAAQDGRCAYCDRLFGALVIIDGKLVALRAEPDHFMPRAKRLNNSSSNIVAACQICNGLKSSRVFTSMTQARAVLQAAWAERGWTDIPLPLPNASRLTLAAPYFLAFRVNMPTCYN